eukprot:gene5853-5921_t
MEDLVDLHLPGALASAATAYGNALAELPLVSHVLVPSETLTPGAYDIGTLALLSGSLTLNGNGDPNAVFVFTAGSSLTTASASTVLLTNGAQACNVFWQVTSSATLGTNSTFVGHIVALASITATTGATINEKIVNLTVNGVIAAAGTWTQTATKIIITTTPVKTGAVLIQLYNGSVPLLAIQSFICAPAATTVIPIVVPTVPTVTTGTIHVIKIVENTYGGTATPGDFTLTLRHHGTDVVGSPAVGVGGTGRIYILAPGTYVLGEQDSTTFPNYIQRFDILGVASQNVVLHAGEDLTITQTNSELPPLVAPVTTPTVTPTPPATVTGGKLPKTGSPWFDLLLFGVGAMVVGGLVLGLKRSGVSTGVALVQIYQMNDFQKSVNIENSKLDAPQPTQSKFTPIKLGEIIGVISIPKLAETYPIVQGTDDKDLKLGVGHYVDSVMPGVKDNSVLSGHRDSVFSKLGQLKKGDLVIVRTSSGTFTYQAAAPKCPSGWSTKKPAPVKTAPASSTAKSYTLNATYTGKISSLWSDSDVQSTVTATGTGTTLGLTQLTGSGSAAPSSQDATISGAGTISDGTNTLKATFDPSASAHAKDGAAPTTVAITGNIIVNGGTGKYAGATGTLKFTGSFPVASTTAGTKDSGALTLIVTGTFTTK